MRLLIIFLFVSQSVFASDFHRDVELSVRDKKVNYIGTGVVNIYNDTTFSGTQNFAGKILNIYAKISGTCTLTNAIIIANPFIQIFDTTVSLGANIQCERFSGMWYGAKPSLNDNSRQLQYAIDACNNEYWPLYIPSGLYHTSQPLMVITGTYGNYGQSTIRMYGDATMWGGGGTRIIYSGDSCALGLQLNKGSTVSGIIFKGTFTSPVRKDSTWYTLTPQQYLDSASGSKLCVGIWVDPIGNFSQRSGSTGCKFDDLQVGNFSTDIKISNSISQNGEILEFNHIQLGDARNGFVTSQPQEKGNLLRNIYCWSNMHTVFNIGRGNYYIDGANIVGAIRLFNVTSQAFFGSHIQNVYAEFFGTVGDFASSLPISISNCVFDFAYTSGAGHLTLLTSNYNTIKFNSCQFRYYGAGDSLQFSGKATFDNCTFSSKVLGTPNSVFVNYSNNIPQYESEVDQTPIKITIKKSR